MFTSPLSISKCFSCAVTPSSLEEIIYKGGRKEGAIFGSGEIIPSNLGELTMIFMSLSNGGLKILNSGSASLCSWKLCELTYYGQQPLLLPSDVLFYLFHECKEFSNEWHKERTKIYSNSPAPMHRDWIKRKMVYEGLVPDIAKQDSSNYSL